ncbi:hypothetical protein [Marinifilum sp.]|uniref:hypothetical protein n=1 Tax=Marinifilum sp. TaxID=2033137 RepID=UPI003BAD1137
MNKVYVLLMVFSFISCRAPQFSHIYHSAYTSLDLRNGNWLVNCTESDMNLTNEDSFAEITVKYFTKLGIDSIDNARKLTLHYITPEHLTFIPSTEVLNLLKQTTKYNYLVNIKANNISNIDFDMGSIDIVKRTVKTELCVYDINTQSCIYHQQVNALVRAEKNPDEKLIYFIDDLEQLKFKALRELLQDIKKRSLK